MHLDTLKTVLQKEKSFPYVTLGAGLFFVFCESLYAILPIDISDPAQNLLGAVTWLLTMTGFTIWFIILFKRSIQKDNAHAKRKLDERELLHEYQVSHLSYNVTILTLCFFTILGSTKLILILGIILFVRFRRRLQLEREN